MAKSKARFLAELLGSTGLVKKSKSELAGPDEVLDLDVIPSIPNSKLQNSSISIAGHSTALGGSVTLDTADIGEHINYKYYTDARARGAVSVSGDLAYNSSTGVISFTERTDAEVRGLVSATGSLSYNSTTGVMSFTMPAQNTSNITEGTNLYFTNARADARIAAASTSDLSEGTNLYYTDARARSAISATGSLSYNSTTGVFSYTTPTTIASLSNHDTADLAEGTNLYFTNARADARIAAASTSDLSEGTNLYYTDARADARVALIVDSAPGTLNTLNELAAALGDDANFSTTVTNSIAAKLPLAGGTLTGVLTVNSTNDFQIQLTSPSSWTGIGFNDSAAMANDYIWHNGTHGTFAIGGGGANVANKKLHVDGGMTIGSGYDATAVTANSLNVEGTISSGAITSTGNITASEKVIVSGNTNAYSTAPLVYFDSTSTASTAVRDWAIGPADDSYGNFHIFVGASTGADPVGNAGRVLTISNTGNATFAGTISSGAITSTGSSTVDTLTVGTGSNTGVLNLKTYDDAANTWNLYVWNDDTLRFNYNGAGADEFVLNSSGNATFTGTISSGAITSSGNLLSSGYLKAASVDSNRFGGDTYSGGGVAMYDNINSAYQTPALVIRKDATETGNVSTAPVSLFIHNGVGKWVKLSLGARETDAGGNTVSIAGIASERTSGLLNNWATGNLHLWTKSQNTQIINQTLKSNGDTEIPGGNLQVSGTVSATNVQGGSGSVTTPIGTVRAHGTSSAYVSASKGSETAFIGVDSSGYAMFGALTNHDAVIRANNTEHLRILTGGNVQIRSGALQMNSTTVIDASRNLTNIGTISSGALTSTGNSSHGGYSSWTAGDGVAGIFMHYNATNSYRGYFDWRTLQLGNNGANNILAGNTAAGGYFNFWVNATAISQAGGTSGINALTISAAGNSTFSGNVSAASFSVGSTTVMDASRNLVNVTTSTTEAEYGQSLNGNFGQWLNHTRYAVSPGFNSDVDYWGWNFVQGTINAPHDSSGQWYRNRVSLGNQYGHGLDSGDYWLEIAHPRTTSVSGSMYIRNCEAGNIGSWVEVGSTIRGSIVAGGNITASSFKDSDDATYYAEFANTTLSGKFRQFVVVGDGTQGATNDGSWGARLNVTDDVHARIEVNQDANSMRSHWYAHTGHDSIKFGTSTEHDVEIVRGNATKIEAQSDGANITGNLKVGGVTVIDSSRQIFAKTGTQVGEDGTYASYGVIGFGGITNGYNRVFGRDGTGDGLFLAAATGRGIYIRPNGGTADLFGFSPSGQLLVSGVSVLDQSRTLTAIAAVDSNLYLASNRALSSSTTGGTVRILFPGNGSHYQTAASATGAIKLVLPVGMTNGMVTIKGIVYEYSTNRSFEFCVGGYNYPVGNTWQHNPFGYITTSVLNTRTYNIRFGFDGSKACIYIGDTNTVWSYPQVSITECTVGYSSVSADTWDDGWDVSFETTLQNVTHTIYAADANSGHQRVLNFDAASFSVGGTTVIGASRNITGAEITGVQLTATDNLYLNGGNYEGQIVFGSVDAWRVGIRQHDDGDAEMRIWAKNVNGRVHIATGYDGQPTSISKPTDGFVVDHNNVGIGNFQTTDPSEKLHVKGNILASGNVTAYSDERLKSDIQTLDGSKVLQMRGVSFTKDGEFGSGVIAQELEKIAPELVRDGEYKSVAYGNITGYLIELAKEQQKEIDELKSLVKQLIAN